MSRHNPRLCDAIGAAMAAASRRHGMVGQGDPTWRQVLDTLLDERELRALVASHGEGNARFILDRARTICGAVPRTSRLVPRIPAAVDAAAGATSAGARPAGERVPQGSDGRPVTVERPRVDGASFLSLQVAGSDLERASVPELVALVLPVLVADDVPLDLTPNATPTVTAHGADGIATCVLQFVLDGPALLQRRVQLEPAYARAPRDWARLVDGAGASTVGAALVRVVRSIARERPALRDLGWKHVAAVLRDSGWREDLEAEYPVDVLVRVRRVAVGAATAAAPVCPSCYEPDGYAVEYDWCCTRCDRHHPDDPRRRCAVEHCVGRPEQLASFCAEHVDPARRPAW